jgi:hypothetical protein
VKNRVGTKPVRMNRGARKASGVKQERVRDGGVRVSQSGGGNGKSEKVSRERELIEILVGVLTELRRLN